MSEDSIKFPEESAEIFRGRLREPFHRRVEFGEATLRRDDEHEHRATSYFLDEEGRVLRLEQDAMRGRMSEFCRGRHAGAEDRCAHDRKGLLETPFGSSVATTAPSRLMIATASAFVTTRRACTISCRTVTRPPPARTRIPASRCSRTRPRPSAPDASSSPRAASKGCRAAGGTSPCQTRASPRSIRAPAHPCP